MRYILFIAAFFISSLAYGQGTWNKSSTNNAWNRTKADSVAIVPRDTIATNNAILPSTGQPVGDYGRLSVKNHLFYVHDSTRNKRVAWFDDLPSVGTFIQNQNASAQVGNYWIDGIGTADTLVGTNGLGVGFIWRMINSSGSWQLKHNPSGNVPLSTFGGSGIGVDGGIILDNGNFSMGMGGTVAPRYMEFTNFVNANQLGTTTNHFLTYDPVSFRMKYVPSATMFAAVPVPTLQSVATSGNTSTVDLIRNNGSVSNVFSASSSAGVIGTTTNHSLGLYTNNLESFRAHRSGAAGSILIPSRAGSFLADDAVSALMVKGPQILARTATTGGVYPHLKLSNESGLTRWELGTLATEGGSNTGFDLLIRGYDNSGTLIGTTPFYMRRDDGSIGLGTTASAGTRLTVNGTTVLGGNTTVLGNGEFTGTVTSGRVGFNGYVGFGVGSTVNSGYVEFYKGATPPTRVGYIGYDNNDLMYSAEGSAVHKFMTAGGAEKMRIAANGNVGIGTTMPTSTLHISGSFAAKIDPVSKTADFTAGEYMTYVINNGAGSPIAVSLPTASTVPDRIYWFKVTTGTLGGTVTIDGNLVVITGTTGPLCIVQSNGTNWILLQGF